MVASLLLCSFVVAADPTPEQRELLTVFREEFVAITPGLGKFPASYTMGRAGGDRSEQPVRVIKFTGSFQVAKYEVPQNLWQAVMGDNPSRWKGKRNSVEMFSFEDALAFCRLTTDGMRKLSLIAADEEIRLPSEAEWEYCARAGTETVYSFGDNEDDLPKYGWFKGNAAGNDPPVGAKAANPWGLFDIHGYLREWCLDDWHDDYSGAPTDGSAWIGKEAKTANPKVSRSGSWKDGPTGLTSTKRFKESPDAKDDALGIRCVLAPVPK